MSSRSSFTSRNKNNKKMPDLVDWDAVEALDQRNSDWGFKLKEILADSKYEELKEDLLDVLTGRELNVEYCQKTGFKNPVLVYRKDDLGMKVPPSNISIDGIRSAVGSRRSVEYVNSKTQETGSMQMKDWLKYWDSDPRQETLNALTLEISKTRLDSQVLSPKIVRQIDWVDKAWPRHLKELQEEGTNDINEMMYPKVQKFVIMSVANCYVDFHVDFGGTSLWYHTLRGFKVFWLVPPTDKNLLLYEKWTREGQPKNKFFGDIAEGCLRIELPAGSTFFMPSGWIHAAFTVKDSVIFCGNYLHSFAIEKQLQIAYIEESTGVPDKFRFPFFTEMLWYVLDRYTTCLLGKSNLDLPKEEKRRMRLEKGENIDPNKEFVNPGLVEEAPEVPEEHVHLTQQELLGLKLIVFYLSQKPPEQRMVPILIPDPAQVIKDVRELVAAHGEDSPDKAVTGKCVLKWTKDDNVEADAKLKKIIPKPSDYAGKLPENPFHKKYIKAMSAKKESGHIETPKKRRIRCRECEGCKSVDCRTCVQCRDMPKYGGPGRMKQTCAKRRCAKPGLPVAAACSKCGLDGWGGTPDPRKPVNEKPATPPNLFECTICLDITHPECAEKSGGGRGVIVPELANSWECRGCHGAGFGQEERGQKNDVEMEERGEKRRGSREGNEEGKKKINPET